MSDRQRSFTPFTQLAPALRNKIWFLTLPDARVIHVVSTRSPNAPISLKPISFVAPSYSWGGQHPALLSVNRESREFGLQHLTPMFGCYWNFKRDALYVEVRQGENPREAVGALNELRKRGMLDDVRHLAIEWRFMNSLRLLSNLQTCTFIYKNRQRQKDVINPGVSWSFVPFNNAQAEFRKLDCDGMRYLIASTVKDFMAVDFVDNEEDWRKRPPGPAIHLRGIGNRKTIDLPPETIEEYIGRIEGNGEFYC
ncbi:hypothetical protein B7494_g2847 [Chlorociboria aeruginascens]|nr:hypothetical protein B7494_g2847 [Chlorociboria aeruginascens]